MVAAHVDGFNSDLYAVAATVIPARRRQTIQFTPSPASRVIGNRARRSRLRPNHHHRARLIGSSWHRGAGNVALVAVAIVNNRSSLTQKESSRLTSTRTEREAPGALSRFGGIS
jgi:hypothetical protein